MEYSSSIERLDRVLSAAPAHTFTSSQAEKKSMPQSPPAVKLEEYNAISLARHLYRSSSSYSSLASGGATQDDRMESGVIAAPGIDRVSSANSFAKLHWDKNDGRLHPEFPLYCEGMPKPACRGMLHLMCTMLLPIGMWHLYNEANGNFNGQVSAVIYTISNIWCYGASATYHVGKWAPKVEILLQKLDHTGIAVMSVGTFIPTIMLLFPTLEGGLFAAMLLAACAWCIEGIIVNNPSLVRQALVPAVSLLFIPRMWVEFSSLEFTCYILTIIVKSLGIMVFVKQKPDPWPAVFGYHEIWHVFVVMGGISIYIANWSMIRRSCQPYERDNNLSEILFPGYFGVVV